MLIIGITLLVGLCYHHRSNPDFYLDYLNVYAYFISLSIGATFLILLMNLTRAGWVVVRRVPEHIMSLLQSLHYCLFLCYST